MADRLLLHKPTGQLYIHQAAFAGHPDFEEVINVEAREVSDEEVAAKAKTTRKKPVETVEPRSIEEQASANLP